MMPGPNEGHFRQGAYPTSVMSKEEALDFQSTARGIVVDYINSHLAFGDIETSMEKVYVVWFSKTLQNWKALVGTDIPDGRYYELTHNGSQHETYLDVYQKLDNLVVQD